MSREKSLLKMLEATAIMQKQIAIILESKAFESEKARNWLCCYLRDEAFTDFSAQLKQSLDVHDQMVELIDSLTRMETSLGKNLKAVLAQNEDSSGPPSGMGNIFDYDGGSNR